MTVQKKGASMKMTALAVGAGVLSSLALAGPSLAAVPTAGMACQLDGKINGRGATFQKNAQDALIAGYELDVCGPVPSAAGHEAGTKMSVYNYTASTARAVKLTGSSNGIRAARCRSDAFAGTDNPYTAAQMVTLRGAVPTKPNSDCDPLNDVALPFTTPFSPSPPPYPYTASWGATVGPFDVQQTGNGPMSFPVAGGAVATGINLPAATCGTTVQLTSINESRLFGGNITNWNDALLREGGVNPSLATCDVPVTRIVRFDGSGTTTIFKNYLKKADGARLLCDGAETWTILATSANNTNWPTGGVCSPLVTGDGNPGVAELVRDTVGGIGYGDLADLTATAPAAILADLRNADDTGFVGPASGTASNCGFPGATMPGTTPAANVGLAGSATVATGTWASDGSPNKSDVTFLSDGYPACGFTWVLVFTGLNGNTSPGAIARLTANQRRTLYSYFSYALSPAAQSRLGAAGFAPLPAAFLTNLRRGFQAGF